MTKTSFENLMALTEASDLLDSVELSLRNNNLDTLADSLSKLQQDAGVQLEAEFNGTDLNDAAPGIQTAALRAHYSVVTDERITRELNQCIPFLEPTAQEDMKTLIASFNIQTPATQTPSAVKKLDL